MAFLTNDDVMRAIQKMPLDVRKKQLIEAKRAQSIAAMHGDNWAYDQATYKIKILYKYIY